MQILPKRTMSLGGGRVEAGKPVEVSEDDGALAIRHGWATELTDKKAAASTKAAPSAEKKAPK